MFAPPWLVGSFQGRGRLGYWGQLSPRPPQQVGGAHKACAWRGGLLTKRVMADAARSLVLDLERAPTTPALSCPVEG